MRSDDIEIALQRLLGASAGPQGIVLTLRRHDEYDLLLEKILALEKQVSKLEYDVRRMSEYAILYLTALDELREARKRLQRAGIDTSFIGSLRRD